MPKDPPIPIALQPIIDYGKEIEEALKQLGIKAREEDAERKKKRKEKVKNDQAEVEDEEAEWDPPKVWEGRVKIWKAGCVLLTELLVSHRYIPYWK
jgi:hypothetical protein